MTRVDLDALERKASIPSPAHPFEITQQGIVMNRVAVGASPVETLALIARIRELEMQARRTIEATGLTVEDELETIRVLLEKGAVIP